MNNQLEIEHELELEIKTDQSQQFHLICSVDDIKSTSHHSNQSQLIMSKFSLNRLFEIAKQEHLNTKSE